MAMLAAGPIDLCFEFSLQPYDIVALIPIIEQAGEIITTLTGERAESKLKKASKKRLEDYN